jgi:hypothetical protein
MKPTQQGRPLGHKKECSKYTNNTHLNLTAIDKRIHIFCRYRAIKRLCYREEAPQIFQKQQGIMQSHL